jgi:hypothetical protein
LLTPLLQVLLVLLVLLAMLVLRPTRSKELERAWLTLLFPLSMLG